MLRRTKIKAAVGIGLAVAALITIPSLAGADVKTNGWATAFASVPLSSGTPIASGTVVTGTARSVGAVVVLWAQPQDSDEPVAISRSSTNATGAWSVGIPSDTDLSGDVDPLSGFVNFTVQSFDATGSSSHFFSAHAAPTTAAAGEPFVDPVAAGTAQVSGTLLVLAVERSDVTGIALVSTDSTPHPALHTD